MRCPPTTLKAVRWRQSHRCRPHGVGGRGGTGVLAVLAFAMLIVSLDQYIVVVALPEIGHDLGFSDRTLQAVISAYAVASAGFLLLGGRAADVIGRRRTLVFGLALYAAASLAGLAPTPELLLVARGAQGLGGALVFPATLSLIDTNFAEGSERNRAVAVWGAAGAAGLVVGVVLGGLLTHTFGWAAVFFVNVPLASAALVLAFALVPVDRRGTARRSLDLPDVFSATLGLTLLVFALVEGPNLGWTSSAVVLAAASCVVFFAAFAAVERRSADPLISRALLRNRNLRTAVALAFLFWATFGSVLYLLSIYLQDVRGYNALDTGLTFLIPTSVVAAGSALGGRLVTRFGLRSTLFVVLAIGALGAVALSLAMSPDGTYAALIPGLVALSIGDGVAFTAIFIAAGTGVPDEEQGVASGLASTSTSVGAAVGLAVLVLVANAGIDGKAGGELSDAISNGLRLAVLVVAAGIIATALLSLTLRPASETEHTPVKADE